MQQQIIIDRAPLRGEYKLWIYKRYLVQSIHFFLSMNNIPSTTISKMQSMGMKKIKRWLGLTRSTTVAVIHHPDMLGLPFLPQLQTKAKLTYLSSIFPSDDSMIQELTILDKPTAGRLGIPSEAPFPHARFLAAELAEDWFQGLIQGFYVGYWLQNWLRIGSN